MYWKKKTKFDIFDFSNVQSPLNQLNHTVFGEISLLLWCQLLDDFWVYPGISLYVFPFT